MRILGVAWYLSLSVAARVLEILSLAPACLGRQGPLVWSVWWVIYCDERATQVWDGCGCFTDGGGDHESDRAG